MEVEERDFHEECQEGTQTQKNVDLPGNQFHLDHRGFQLSAQSTHHEVAEDAEQRQEGFENQHLLRIDGGAPVQNDDDIVIDNHGGDDNQDGALDQDEQGFHLGKTKWNALADRLVNQRKQHLIDYQNNHIHRIVDAVDENRLRSADDEHGKLEDCHGNAQPAGQADGFLFLVQWDSFHITSLCF